MDQLKNMLPILKKHYFWALLGLIVVLGLASWVMATSDSAKRFGTRKSAIGKHFEVMTKISTAPNHPNAAVIQAKERATDLLRQDVLKAWTTLSDEQKKNNRLSADLSPEFRKAFAKLGPNNRELPNTLREEYQHFAKDSWNDKKDERGNVIQKGLFSLVGSSWPSEERAKDLSKPPRGKGPDAVGPKAKSRPTDREGPTRGPGGGPTAAVGPEGEKSELDMVFWSREEREKLVKRFEWPDRTPTTREVLLAQEDLWVYEALLKVISNTNVGATSYYDAAIRKIEALKIGEQLTGAGPYAASGRGGTGSDYAAAATGTSFEGHVGRSTGAPAGGRPSDAGTSGAAAGQEALPVRYVDAENRSAGADPLKPEGGFKRMPILMRVVIDQRNIYRLLVECANGSMPIEVRSVRFRPLEGRTPFEAPSAGGGPSFGFTPPKAKTPSGKHGEEQEPNISYYVPIEIEGVIYIFNPPDKTWLGVSADSQEKPGTTPESTPKTETSTTPASETSTKTPTETPTPPPETATTPDAGDKATTGSKP